VTIVTLYDTEDHVIEASFQGNDCEESVVESQQEFWALLDWIVYVRGKSNHEF
jgi:hypothetical protein